jgi:transcription initiation factor TFIIIB Brf1 subunit/transcription initiation factor TFIIB
MRCPICNGPVVNFYERGESTCTNCGYVIQTNITPETPPTNSKHNKIGSMIKYKKNSPYNKLIKIHNKLLKMKTTNTSILIEKYTKELHINNEQIKNEIKELIENTKHKGYRTKALITASIFIACKKHNIPIKIEELLKLTKINRKTFTRHLNLVYNKNKIKNINTNYENLTEQILQKILPKNHPQYQQIKQTTLQLIQQYKQHYNNSKTPRIIITTAIYTTLKKHNIPTTLTTITKLTNTSQTAIRTTTKQLQQLTTTHPTNTPQQPYNFIKNFTTIIM